MNFKRDYKVPEHLREDGGLPRSQDERLLWIRRRIEDGYYESERVKKAIADALSIRRTIGGPVTRPNPTAIEQIKENKKEPLP